MKKIVVIGCAGTAQNIIEQITDAINKDKFDFLLHGIVIDSFPKGSIIAGVSVLGGIDIVPSLLFDKDVYFLFSLYKPEILKERFVFMRSLNIPHDRYINFVHPSAYVARTVKMGTGNVILSNSIINSNVIVGDMNIINGNVSIEHDTVIGNGNFFAAGAVVGSSVSVGNHCFFGLNSSVRENVTLDEVFVGMGSIVLNDCSNCSVIGKN
jgi:UDP-3-O-[3-hydroxymyristoyl] glucosamine N-acyltransferase